jgi:hypothetical protein
MKSRFLLPVIAIAALSSCSTVYKSGQTPDDVYFSPAREGAEYVDVSNDNYNRRYRSYEYDNAEDRWLRMRVRNPYRWNAFDDYDWNMYSGWSNNWNNPYSYSWNSYWNGYWTWNSWYNPYCRNVIVVNPKTNPAAYSKVRNFSLSSYTNNNYGNVNNFNRPAKGLYRSSSAGSNGSYYNNSNSNSLGNSLRKVFSGNNNGGGTTNGNVYTPSSGDRPTRSYTPSSSSSSSGSSSSGSRSSGSSSSGGSVSRPGRGG